MRRQPPFALSRSAHWIRPEPVPTAYSIRSLQALHGIQSSILSSETVRALKTIVISDDEFAKIADRDESHFFDIKQHAATGKSIQKIGAAFSNADGGELIIGIKDKKTGEPLNKRWEGIVDIEQLNEKLQAVFEVKPALDVAYEFLKRETVGGYALRVLIEKGTRVSATPDGKIYLRQGAQSLPVADPDRVQQLSFAKGASSFEDILLADLPAEQIVESPVLTSFLGDYSPTSIQGCAKQRFGGGAKYNVSEDEGVWPKKSNYQRRGKLFKGCAATLASCRADGGDHGIFEIA